MLQEDTVKAKNRFYPGKGVRKAIKALEGKRSLVGHDTDDVTDVVAKIERSFMKNWLGFAEFKFGTDTRSEMILSKIKEGLIDSTSIRASGVTKRGKVNGEFVLKVGELKVGAKSFKIVMFTILGLWSVNQIFLTTVRHASIGVNVAWGLIFGTIALVVSLEKLVEKILPDGARRHRILGRGTMIIYGLLLITSTATYLMLYVIYPAK